MTKPIITTIDYVIGFIIIFAAIFAFLQHNIQLITILLAFYTVYHTIAEIYTLEKRLSGKVRIWIDKNELEKYRKFGVEEEEE